MIPHRNLSLLSNRLAREGGRRIPESVLERDYCLAWFLIGLSRSPLREMLAFKGGTAIKRCYFGDYRFSEDLDFTLTAELPFEDLRTGLEPVFREVHKASGVVFRFVREDRQRHVNSHTFYVAYDGPIPARTPSEVKVDVTIRECLVFPVVERPVLRGYDEYDDLPDTAMVRVYSLEEISAEKIVALGDRARNEPRDLYDIWHLTSEGCVILENIKAEVEEKLNFRGRSIDTLGVELRNKEARLKKLWSVRLAAQMTSLPQFDGVFRAVLRSLRQAGLIE